MVSLVIDSSSSRGRSPAALLEKCSARPGLLRRAPQLEALDRVAVCARVPARRLPADETELMRRAAYPTPHAQRRLTPPRAAGSGYAAAPRAPLEQTGFVPVRRVPGASVSRRTRCCATCRCTTSPHRPAGWRKRADRRGREAAVLRGATGVASARAARFPLALGSWARVRLGRAGARAHVRGRSAERRSAPALRVPSGRARTVAACEFANRLTSREATVDARGMGLGRRAGGCRLPVGEPSRCRAALSMASSLPPGRFIVYPADVVGCAARGSARTRNLEMWVGRVGVCALFAMSRKGSRSSSSHALTGLRGRKLSSGAS